MVSIEAACRIGMMKASSVDHVIIDTTVLPKALAFPSDSRLFEKSRQHLVKLANEHQIDLRQNYNREAPRLAAQVARYAHAKQFKRMKKAIRTFRARVGRVQREIERKIDRIPETHQVQARDLLYRVNRIRTQKPKDKNKLYAVHAPEVECISKGKAHKPYEFGVKVNEATTLIEGLVVGMRSMSGNPWKGHSLAEALEQVGIITNRQPKTAIVDKGHQGVEIPDIRILRSGQRRRITRTLKRKIKRRSANEPTIGHMKTDGRLDRNPLKGTLGDTLHAVMRGAGHIRLLLKKLRLLCAEIRQWILSFLYQSTQPLMAA